MSGKGPAYGVTSANLEIFLTPNPGSGVPGHHLSRTIGGIDLAGAQY